MHAFVDESTRRRYLLVAIVAIDRDLARLRRLVRGLILPGQRRIHFKKETDSRRWRIVQAITTTVGLEALVYEAGPLPRGQYPRDACLEQLVADLADRGASRLIIERDDSIAAADRRVLYQAVHKAGCAERLRYLHLRAHEECLLGLPDAVAWCWAKGAAWRRAVEPVIGLVRRL